MEDGAVVAAMGGGSDFLFRPPIPHPKNKKYRSVGKDWAISQNWAPKKPKIII
jgi:hypothetical protein